MRATVACSGMTGQATWAPNMPFVAASAEGVMEPISGSEGWFRLTAVAPIVYVPAVAAAAAKATERSDSAALAMTMPATADIMPTQAVRLVRKASRGREEFGEDMGG